MQDQKMAKLFGIYMILLELNEHDLEEFLFII